MDGRRAAKHRQLSRDARAHTAGASRCSARRNAVISPNSASARTAVTCSPAARARRINVSAWRHFSWNDRVAGMLRRGAPVGVARPRLAADTAPRPAPRARARPQRRGHRDLAIGDLAQRAAVLARHADRVRALFRKAGAVEDQHAAALGQHLQAAAARSRSASHGACVMKC